MRVLSRPTRYLLTHPVSFALQTLRSFYRNQGLLLAGAMAYYALLSVVPLLIISVIGLSHLVDQAELLRTLGGYLEWVVPGQSRAVLADVNAVLANRGTIGAALLVTMLFFSSVAFSVLEKAMSIILARPGTVSKRHFLVSAALPYCFVLLLGLALLGVTLATIILQSIAEENVHVFGRDWSLNGLSGALVYLLGFSVEALILAILYRVMPVTPIRLNHALVGGFSAALLWEVLRHLLVWYLAAFSRASLVYGSLTTAVVVLLSSELAATVLLLGAQVIANYERLRDELDPAPGLG